MTIEQILSNSSKGSELTNRILFNSLKLQIESCFSDVVKNYCQSVTKTISDIALGDASRLGYYRDYKDCCTLGDHIGENKVMLSDELKEELISAFKDIVTKEVENYKSNLKLMLKLEEKQEEKKEEAETKQVEITVEKTPVPQTQNYFGY